MARKLLLIGAGHAHVQVIAALAKKPLPDTEVTLVAPYPRQIYSGMLPGWITGRYGIDECTIPVRKLAERTSIRFVEANCTQFNANEKNLTCDNGEFFDFDIASINTGSCTRVDKIPGACENGIPIRPIESFIARWPALVEQVRQSPSNQEFRLAVIGGGAAGTELALAIQSCFVAQGLMRAKVSLIGSRAYPLDKLPVELGQKVLSILQGRGIDYLGERRVISCLAAKLNFADNTSLNADAMIFVTGADAPDWTKNSGLETDSQGFIRVLPTLQSISHPDVFSAGDIAAYTDARPKSGVFAVRAGLPLTRNIYAACSGNALQNWRPQAKALYLINTGYGHALGARGSLCFSGRWVWRWKDWIDRRFMRRFS